MHGLGRRAAGGAGARRMIKDLVVNLGLGRPRDVSADYAISIA